MATTTLYGRTINLSELARSHPGGTVALSMAAGRDCTELYEQYHPHATSKHDFHGDLLRAARDIGCVKASWSHVTVCGVVAVAAAEGWRQWALGNAWSLFFLPVLHWLLLANVAHEAAHFAFSSSPLVNEILALSSAPLFYNTGFWYLQHNVSHHGNTNHPESDLDLNHFHPIARLHGRSANPRVHAALKCFTIFMAFFFATLVQSFAHPFQAAGNAQFLGDARAVLDRTRWSSWLQLSASAAVLVVPWLLWGAEQPAKAALFGFAPFFASSLLFMGVTQVSHIQASTQADVVPAPPHWAIHQVQSSLDYSQGSRAVTFFTGGLNAQGLHHCVPFMSSSHFVEFYPKYRELCKKHGVKIREVSAYADALRCYVAHVVSLT
jgi:fatty acid desaturase